MCLDFSCETRSRCSGNGICVDYEKCQWNDNWIGLSCETPTCYDVNNCSSNGLCVSPNKCECFEQYDGVNYTEEIAVNLNTPIFLNESYSAVVSENQGKDFVILTVSANDSDHGRSGEISYSIEEANIANLFMISQDSGEITVAADGVLDYESISQKQFTFTVGAIDNGIPTRSSEATVTIAVKDENDNCPVFKTFPGNYKIPVEILANDDDYGDNGQIQYSITEESDPDQKFFITSNGTLLANSILQPGAYLLTIVAQDQGVIPCARELSLTVVVDEIVSPNVLPTTTLITTEPSSVMSSTIGLQQSSSLQSSTIVPEPSSSLQSSTIVPEPSSSLQSITIVPEQSSSLPSSTIVPEPPSSL
ncbi:protocadherin-11 Y-linked-like [Paramuricea clavata]|uniref:Protocadherin-11 Y-linked-like n=1 Tax=Paramuricea clavata TaxID=317549 RepID=A0A6S7GQU3_PARCT|nr:protocadherin-11 Y-linked-like [Paramuricea clavata]